MPDSWNCDTQKSWTFALKSPMTNLWLTWEVRWYGPFGPHSPDIVLQLPKFSCLPGPLLKNLDHNLPECHCLGISGRLHQHSTHGKLQTAKLLTDWQTQKGMTLSLKNQPVEKLLWYIDLQKLQGKSCFFCEHKANHGIWMDLEIYSKQINTKIIQNMSEWRSPTNLLNSAIIFQRCSFTHDGLHLGAQHDARRISGAEIMESSLPVNMKIIWSWVDIKGTHPFFGEPLGPFWGDFPILSSVYTENIHSYVLWNYSLNLVKNCECFVRNQGVQFVTPILRHWHIISPSCIESAIGDVHLTCGGVITIQKTHYCTIAWRDRLSFHKQLAAHQADTTNWLSQHVAMTLTMGKICKNTWQNNGGEVPSALQSCTWNLAVKSGRTPRHTHHPPTLPAVSPFPAKTLWQGAITDAPGCGGPTMGWIEDRSIICIAVFWIHKYMYIYIYTYIQIWMYVYL